MFNTAFFTWQNILIIGVVAFVAVWVMNHLENKQKGNV